MQTTRRRKPQTVADAIDRALAEIEADQSRAETVLLRLAQMAMLARGAGR